MSTLVAMGTITKSDNWLISLACLCIGYFVLYPTYLLFLRWKHTRLIKRQLVTSMYTLPIHITPTELSYIFSTRVSERQLKATLLDLANRSVLLLDKKGSRTVVDEGPKIEKNLKIYEKLLIDYVHKSDEPVDMKRVTEGFTRFKTTTDESVHGSRQYVFWWLLRYSMQSQKIINTSLTRIYARLLIKFGVITSFVLLVAPVVSYRAFLMLFEGEIMVDKLLETAQHGAALWAILLLPTLIASFLLLRLQGRMIGRYWLLTKNYQRYLEQFESYREFVRLTHKKRLRFESKELERESLSNTRAYAMALGYYNN
jgi:hypothetical protein